MRVDLYHPALDRVHSFHPNTVEAHRRAGWIPLSELDLQDEHPDYHESPDLGEDIQESE